MARRCLTCGTITDATRCARCYKAQQRDRNTQRGDRYGTAHQKLRAQWAPIVALGHVPCARCGQPITGAWDLDHVDDGPQQPSHAWCNRSAARRQSRL